MNSELKSNINMSNVHLRKIGVNTMENQQIIPFRRQKIVVVID